MIVVVAVLIEVGEVVVVVVLIEVGMVVVDVHPWLHK